jgi:hypothetical protein
MGFVDRGMGFDLTITQAGGGMGTVKRAAERKVLVWGTVVTLTPVPDSNYYFGGWSGADGDDVYRDGSSWKIRMDDDKTIVALFSTAPVPIITVSGSGFSRTISIETTPSGPAIYYTDDGTAPTTSSTVYGSSIAVSGYYVTKTIKAIAVESGTVSSATSKDVSITPSAALGLSTAVSTFAGSTTSGSGDGTGTSAGFSSPKGLTTDGTNLYVCDYNNHTIRQIGISTGAVTTLAGKAGSSGSTDATGTSARFNYPRGITTDGTNLYIAEYGNSTIRKIVIATGVVTTLAGKAGSSGSTDATGIFARFNQPQGIATDGTNLYVTDTGSNTIRKIVIATGAVTTLAGTAGSSGTTDATGTFAKFQVPVGITSDGTNLYVVDNNNHTIRKIVIATGVVTTFAGTAGGSGPTDATGTSAKFKYPYDITTDGTNLYVADTYNFKVRKIVISSAVVTSLAGTGSYGSGDNTTGTFATFKYPNAITTDGTSIYVADTDNNMIRKIE